MPTIGKRIKALRIEMNIGQIELGKRAGGIQSGVISRYENDLIESPKMQHLLAIAAALNANPQYIIDGSLPVRLSKLSGSLSELNDIAKDLDPDALAMIIAAAKSLRK